MCLTVLGQVLSVDEQRGVAIVEVRGTPRAISVAPLVLDGDPPDEGEWVLVHTGMAIATVDESEARQFEAFVLGLQQDEEEPWTTS